MGKKQRNVEFEITETLYGPGDFEKIEEKVFDVIDGSEVIKRLAGGAEVIIPGDDIVLIIQEMVTRKPARPQLTNGDK